MAHSSPGIPAQSIPQAPADMPQPNESVEITPPVSATPKPNFLTPPPTEEERPKFKRKFFHNCVDPADWTERDLARMTPEAREDYERFILRDSHDQQCLVSKFCPILFKLARVMSLHIIMTYVNDDAPPQSMLMMMRHYKPPHATTKIRVERPYYSYDVNY